MAGEIATAFVGLVPSVDKSFGTKISQQITPAAARAGDVAGMAAGSRFSGMFGSTAQSGAASSAAAFGSTFSRDVNGKLRDVNGRFVQEAGKAGTAGGTNAGRGFTSSVGGAIKGIGGLMAGAFAVQKVGQFFGSIISEATEAQKVGALTAQVIKTTGGAANVTADQIGNLSTAISNKVGIDDEAIQSGANLLLTFKNIRNETGKGNDIFNQSTQAVTDMSVAMGTDMKSSAIQVGKALNDPIKGITALTRVGVTFSDEQKKQIANFVKTGDVASAQKIILGELNSEFGGAAAAGTTAGEKLTVTWGNFKETLGTAVLPVLQKAQSFIATQVLPAVLDFFQSGGDKASKFGSVVSRIGDVFGAVFGAVKQFLTDNQATFLMWWASIESIFKSLQTLVVTVVGFIQQFWTAHGEQIMAVVSVVWSSIKTIITSALSIISGVIRFVIAVITGDWSGAWDAIKDVLKAAWTGILAIIKGAWAILTALWTVALSLLKSIWSVAWDGIKALLSTVWDGIKTLISGALTTIKGWISTAWDSVKSTTSTAWDNVKTAVTTKVGELITFVTGIPGKILSALGDLGSLLYDAGKNIIQGLIDGIGSMIGKIGDAISGVVDKVKDFLPWSPAKEGPLRTHPPEKGGANIGRMLAQGILSQQSAVAQAAGMLAGAAVVDPMGARSPRVPRGAGSSVVRRSGVTTQATGGGNTLVYSPVTNYPFRGETSRERNQAGVAVGLFGEFLGQPGGGVPIFQVAR